MPSQRTRLSRWLCGGLTLAVVPGCASVWDDVTSKNFREKPFATMFTSPEPMAVLRNPDSSGDDRAKAIHKLKEPVRSGAGQTEQDEVIGILQTAALNEKQPLCRLEAIDALARFQDPRAVQILLSAYATLQPETGVALGTGVAQVKHEQIWERSYTNEANVFLQCRVLQALGDTRRPEALPALTATLQKKAKPNASEAEAQQTRELHAAAVRALANYPGDRTAATALVQELQTEKDIALRDRTRESLVTVTGRDVPADAAAWQKVLANPESAPPASNNPLRQVGAWFK